MAGWNPTILMLLCCVCWCSGDLVDDCSPQGPDNCTFEENVDLASRTADFTWCTWKADIHWTGFRANTAPWMLSPGLYYTSSVTGSMTSRKSCSTQGDESCFSFRYKFDVADEIDLNVYIQNSVRLSDVKVWSASRGFLHDFQQAYIPISTQFDFSVVIEATRRRTPSENNTNTVFVDDLQFVNSPCPTCFAEGPENCTFQISYQIGYSTTESVPTTCSWTTSGGWSSFHSPPLNYDVGLRWHTTSGQMTSRPACSTNGHTHCLMFDYLFDRSDTVKLDVFIQSTGSEGRKKDLWSKQRVQVGNSWERAYVSVSTTFDFVVVFEATRLSNETLNKAITVGVDNIEYAKAPCDSVLHATDSTAVSIPPDTTDNAPLIAGVTVAVILSVFVIIGLLLVLHRRRRQDSSNTRPQVEVVFQNAVVSIEDSIHEEAQYTEVVDIVESNSQPTPFNVLVDNACVESSPDRRAESNNRNRNSQTTPQTPFGNSATSIESFQEDTLADFDEMTTSLNINSPFFPSTALTDLAANIKSPPEEIHDHHGIVENLNRKRSSQTFLKTPCTDLAANDENSHGDRADYKKLDRNRHSQTTLKTPFQDSPDSTESSHEERAGYENLKRNRSSQTFPKSPCTVSTANIENCPEERADYEKLGRNRNSQTTPKSIVPNSAANIESSPAERADYEKLNTNRSSQTFPKTPLSAVNVESSPAERADYEKLDTNRSSQTFPKTPPTDSAAVDIESSLREMADHETSLTVPKVPFTVETGAVRGSPVDNRTEGVVNDSVLFPSEMYSRLLSRTDQGHDYTELKSSAPASKCESEDG